MSGLGYPGENNQQGNWGNQQQPNNQDFGN